MREAPEPGNDVAVRDGIIEIVFRSAPLCQCLEQNDAAFLLCEILGMLEWHIEEGGRSGAEAVSWPSSIARRANDRASGSVAKACPEFRNRLRGN